MKHLTPTSLILASLGVLSSRPSPISGRVLLYYFNNTLEAMLPDGTIKNILDFQALPPGGNEGYVLKKTSDLNYQFDWSPPDFTDEQRLKIIELIFTPGTVSLTTNISSFEKNVSTNVTWTYLFTPNEDVFSSATLNSSSVGASGSIITNIKTSQTLVYEVTLVQQNFDVSQRQISQSRTVSAREPQYYGVSSTIVTADGFTYEELAGAFTKVVQSSSTITATFTASNEYVFFLSTKSNAKIYDGNNFDNTDDFAVSTITVKYADGTNQTLYQYRSKGPKTITGFIYKIQ